ncbi:replication initiation factor domain-containing protein [Photobacterium angustum]|uniref:Replication initiation protein-like C-terminal domain-containing protein n=1 Tax=Photobacterium angustum TaxID=661 RepID=A0A855SD49_PHOAN|nr:replication initiation factor domain-containing protein [Photobacterium angustum]KJF83149.1 hypothetical protein UB36_00700 [Photobacterium damselae subsp. damselae]KJG43008.1 hypothetical protein UA35_03340 [Photobacterium angustum]KJG47457.1 hypothetical protein UA31_00700 [Photobacterium angustum]KJG49300.1 hypothetical protein UA30_08945 [Photobacterium angustum]KJG53616.1 hypothetical protein UA34_04670 [Photobacterium angustum]
MKNNKPSAIIDFLSFSWCPTELARIYEVAKTGASIKAMKFFEFNTVGEAIAHLAQDNARLDYKKIVGDLLDNAQFVFDEDTPKQRFQDVKKDLLNHFGLNTLDCLCRGEIDRFINRLNHGLGTFGNDWTFELKSGGFSGYPHSATIRVNGQQAGLCAWGAKNHGCYVSFSGVGCAALDMSAVHDAIAAIPNCKITRVDIAHDSFEGKYNVDDARDLAEQGAFVTKGRPSSYCYIESGHLTSMVKYQKEAWRGNEPKSESLTKRYGFTPDKGRSFYVGTRDAGKMLRVYEKGKQLKSTQNPDWVRWELELRAKDRVIPFDVLLSPANYLSASYPALQFVEAEQQCEIKTLKRKYFTCVDNAIKNGATQCGKLINYLKHAMEYSDESIIKLMTGHLYNEDIPDRLILPALKETEESLKVNYNKPLSSWEDIYKLA